MKDVLPDLKGLGSYDEVIDHLISCHGAEGKKIALDPNQAPFMWHELVGHAVDTNHNHYGNREANIDGMMELVSKIVSDPEFRKEFEEVIASEDGQIKLQEFEERMTQRRIELEE
jgi:hypothetical protein